MKSENSSKTFGQIIRIKREEHDWTGQELLDRVKKHIDGSLSTSYLSRIEKVGEIPSPKLTQALSIVLGIEPEELFEQARKEKIMKFTQEIEKTYSPSSLNFSTSMKKSL